MNYHPNFEGNYSYFSGNEKKYGIFYRNDESYNIVQLELKTRIINEEREGELIKYSTQDLELIPQLIVDLSVAPLQATNKNIISRERIYLVHLSFYVSNKMLYREGMSNIFGVFFEKDSCGIFRIIEDSDSNFPLNRFNGIQNLLPFSSEEMRNPVNEDYDYYVFRNNYSNGFAKSLLANKKKSRMHFKIGVGLIAASRFFCENLFRNDNETLVRKIANETRSFPVVSSESFIPIRIRQTTLQCTIVSLQSLFPLFGNHFYHLPITVGKKAIYDMSSR